MTLDFLEKKSKEKFEKEAARAGDTNALDVLIAGMQEVAALIKAIPEGLLKTPQGAGIAAIMIGALMKKLGIGILKKEFRIVKRFQSKSEKWLWDENPESPGLVIEKGSEDAACRFMSESNRNNVCESFIVEDPLVIDVFPFEIIGVIREDFGKMAVPDMLMTGGFMALTGDFWKGVGEIIPG